MGRVRCFIRSFAFKITQSRERIRTKISVSTAYGIRRTSVLMVNTAALQGKCAAEKYLAC